MLKTMCLAACMLSCLIVSGQKLKLSVPKVNHSLVMLSGSPVALEFDFRMEAAEIRYTKDGTDPIPTSLLYKNTLKVLKPGTIKARAFHNDFMPSDVITFVFVQNGKKISSIKVNDPNEKYKGNGSKTLYDGIFGDMDFKKAYLGYRDTTLVAELFPAKSSMISKLSLSYLINQGSWIFGPVSIRVTDIRGQLIGEQILTDTQVKQSPDHIIRNINIKKKKYKYLKITIAPIGSIPTWHDGKGNRAWLFVDEIWVE